jgi:hypothetical protein
MVDKSTSQPAQIAFVSTTHFGPFIPSRRFLTLDAEPSVLRGAWQARHGVVNS